MLILTAILIVIGVALIELRFGVLLCLASLVALLGLTTRRSEIVLWAHGSAGWANSQILRLAQMIGSKDGIGVGRINEYRRAPFIPAAIGLVLPWVGSKDACDGFVSALSRKPVSKMPEIRLSKCQHSIFVSPTGQGKSTMIAVNELKRNRSSMVVNDSDGSLARITADYRRRVFGHTVVELDPFFCVTKTPATLNPLSLISRGSKIGIDMSRDFAAAMTVRPPNEREPHWLDNVENLLSVAILTLVELSPPDQCNLQSLRRIVADPTEFAAMIACAEASDAHEGMLSRMGRQLRHYVDRELASTMTTANRSTRFLDSLAVRDSTCASSFDPRDLRRGPMTVYMIVPLQRRLAPLTRLWISTLLYAVMEGGPIE
jgi:type IV secretion system protein VirD4